MKLFIQLNYKIDEIWPSKQIINVAAKAHNQADLPMCTETWQRVSIFVLLSALGALEVHENHHLP